MQGAPVSTRCRVCGAEPGLAPDRTVVRHYAPGLNHIYVSAKRCKGSRKAPQGDA